MNALVHDFTPASVGSVGDRIFADPARTKLRTRPLKAFGHFRRLLKDKENTAEVFAIFEALPRRDFVPSAEAFMASERAKLIYRQEPELPAILDDHASLRELGPGTVAAAYCDFMEREGLSAAGLVEEEAKSWGDRPRYDDILSWYGRRHRDTHDLLHVLTGYGRDPLGEQCVLAFTFSQSPSPAHLFIAYLGGLHIKRQTKTKAPVLAAIREGQALGKACPRIAEMSIRELLAMPLDEARRKLNITPARRYAEAHRIWREEGQDPYELMKPQTA
jgi:ubiquinone biosynthesis protein COQ4